MVHSGLMRQTLKGPMYQNGITLLIPAMETGDGYINNDSLGSYRKKGKQFPNLKPRNQSYLQFFIVDTFLSRMDYVTSSDNNALNGW